MWNIDEFLSGLNIDLDRLRDVFTYDPQAPMILAVVFSSGCLSLLYWFICCCNAGRRRVCCLSPCFPITSIIKVVALISSCLDW